MGPDVGSWYKDATVYEVHVRAFADSNGDGIGDFGGLVEHLGYLQDLGVSALWLLPFYPSPLRDDGYDIADYRKVHPSYGSLRDFRRLLEEAHRRGMRVITELVLAHTSDAHWWFQRARRAPRGSWQRDYYLWSDTADGFRDARVIFRDFESSNWTFDTVAGAYFWHRFYAHQPSLNYDSPKVRLEMLAVVDHWLRMGVDGLRLDAVPYLYAREGTTCENLPETFAFLRELRGHVDEQFPGRLLLAEANQWPEDAAAYLESGVCHMAFHFPLMPRMFMAARQEDRFPIVDILSETPVIPRSSQWALFLRNHDELTLEMVTDEERDYMYRTYAQDPQSRVNLGIRRRLAPLLNNDRGLIELMNGLLCSLPGTPIIYYGDEIGMGDNIYLGDRDAVRTPMQWAGDQNAGFSRANPQRLYLPVVTDPVYHPPAVNVTAQEENPGSLLWWMRRLLSVRARHPAFARGELELLLPENRKVLAYLRSDGQERLLVVANLSRHAQAVELDLSAHVGAVPRELFGAAEFPTVDERPYRLTLGPHGFYWLALETPRATRGRARPLLAVEGAWERILSGRALMAFEDVLPGWLTRQPWLVPETRPVRSAELFEAVPLGDVQLALVGAEGGDGATTLYTLPLGFAVGERAEELLRTHPDAVVCELMIEPPRAGRRRRAGALELGQAHGVVFDAGADPSFTSGLVDAVARRRRVKGHGGHLVGVPVAALRGRSGDLTEPVALRSEPGSLVVGFPGRIVARLRRRVEAGVDPVTEVGHVLAEHDVKVAVPQFCGSLEYRFDAPAREPVCVATFEAFVPSEGEGWSRVLDQLVYSLEELLAAVSLGTRPLASFGLLEWAEAADHGGAGLLAALPEAGQLLVGAHLPWASLLGARIAELHLNLAERKGDPAFAPERIGASEWSARAHEARSAARRAVRLASPLADEVVEVRRVLEQTDEVLRRLRGITSLRAELSRIRCHGNLGLEQVLWTGKDFVLTGLGGPSARTFADRRRKRIALVDVASMLRSLYYAARVAPSRLNRARARVGADDELEAWLTLWYRAVGGTLLGSYLERASGACFVPARRADLALILEFLLLEKAVTQLGEEARSRPEWASMPARAILELVAGE